MTNHSVEDYYKKINVLHDKAIELHRERFKTSGSYDKTRCKFIIDDIKYLARLISETDIDMDKDFGK
tara:strand:+ start:542 stop:742 length:201 start_codon:yes stop_codon:yes gene_type:complete